MRLVTNFRDYYDCMAAHDGEREPVFVRNKAEAVEVVRPAYGNGAVPLPPVLRMEYIANSAVVGFCGVFYPLLVVERVVGTDRNGIDIRRYRLIYDRDEAVKYGVKRKGRRATWKNARRRARAYYAKNDVADFFDYYARHDRPAQKAVVDEYGPVFVVWTPETMGRHYGGAAWVERNANLGELGFAKVMPPPMAWNALTNFISNIARPARPIPEMDNETKIHQAGFNTKTSFRKTKACP